MKVDKCENLWDSEVDEVESSGSEGEEEGSGLDDSLDNEYWI